MTNSKNQFDRSDFIAILRHRAQQQAEQRAYTFLPDGETEGEHITFAELDQKARTIAGWLQSQNAKGERALLLFPPGLEYVAAFFGCLYAGVIAVPAYPPRRNKPMPRIHAIVSDAAAKVALTTTEILADIEQRLAHAPDLAAMRWKATDQDDSELAGEWHDPQVSGDDAAFLQYTSGSTATPKGVIVSHSNLIHNSSYIDFVQQNDDTTVGGTWLPSFHDMGLIEGILQPMFNGSSCYFMPPVAFLQRPIRWLNMITRYKITNSGGPNFGYDLCVQRVTPEQLETLDLSSWRCVYNGAEPIRRQTLERFYDAFKPCGFRWKAFYPVYGMAEATLMVSSGRLDYEPVFYDADAKAYEQDRILAAEPGAENARKLVASGKVYEDYFQAAIVHPETMYRCNTGEIGEIWLKGGSIALGYWNRPDESKEAFGAYIAETDEGPYLRTGDLGFIRDGELFVTGRLKDLIIVAGRNHYPQDIEQTAEQSHPAVRPGCSAAFSVDDDGAERLFVVCEIRREYLRKVDTAKVVAAIREAVAAGHELRVHEVHLIKPTTIPKTSSGKIQRRACKTQLLAGELALIGDENGDETPVEQSAVAEERLS